MSLTAKQLATLAARLGERHAQLLRDVREELEHGEDRQYAKLIGQIPGDAADQSVADFLAELNISILDRHVEGLRDVEAAKSRMADGTYGICVECGGEIGFARLCAYPAATRCIRCQQQREKTYAHENTPSL